MEYFIYCALWVQTAIWVGMAWYDADQECKGLPDVSDKFKVFGGLMVISNIIGWILYIIYRVVI